MTKRINKIILIGNGFDISHGLKTKYQDFLKSYLLKCVDETEECDYPEIFKFEDSCIKLLWNRNFYKNGKQDVKADLSQQWSFGNDLKKYIKNYNKYDRPNSNLEIYAKNSFVYSILRECFSSNWSGIEDCIYSFLKQCHIKLKGYRDDISISKSNSKFYNVQLEHIKSLNASVECFKSNLISYLRHQNSPESFNFHLFDNRLQWGWKFDKNLFKNMDGSRDVLFLNFNYTTYYIEMIQKYQIKEHFTDNHTVFDFINIHGNINDSIDDIIFGVGDEQDTMYSEIETLYDNEWLKNIKSFHYFRKEYYQKILGFIARGDYEIFVIGHSCSITDRTLLNMLFENEACKKIHVYHYKGIDSYLSTTYNIARNFKDKVKLREVLMPYNPNLNMNP
ncbi:AbiH family protein [Sphingobacterium spiritivorum]|uniref:AbiH family protein n=1 Tax=Sphingobacterium spiritivorum TaxID=258 RepID=UPI003DA40082